jgi:hypothetical protein
MRPTMRARLWVEVVLAVGSGAALVLTLVSKEWIELLTGLDPDHGSGSAERAIVAVSALLLITCATLGRYEWRRAVAARA